MSEGIGFLVAVESVHEWPCVMVLEVNHLELGGVGDFHFFTVFS